MAKWINEYGYRLVDYLKMILTYLTEAGDRRPELGRHVAVGPHPEELALLARVRNQGLHLQ